MPLFRRSRGDDPPDDPLATLDLAALPRRLAPVVADAIAASTRWRRLVGSLDEGPVRDRLVSIGERVDGGVVEMHATARRVGEVERILATLDPESAAVQFKRAKRGSLSGDAPPELQALQERFEATQRLLNLVDDAEARLRVLDARLEATVARGAEVAITASESGFDTLDHDLSDVRVELTALRQGLEAVN